MKYASGNAEKLGKRVEVSRLFSNFFIFSHSESQLIACQGDGPGKWNLTRWILGALSETIYI